MSVLYISVDGVALGKWISKKRNKNEPVKFDITVDAKDGAEETIIKLLVQRMVCPDPTYRIPISDVYTTTHGTY